MANPGGGNQFGSYQLQPQYGDVKKLTQLTKAAPISGAPQAAQALGAPKRAQRATQRKAKPAPPVPPAQTQPEPVAPSLAATWQQIAQIPGISPLAQEYANVSSQLRPPG